MNTSRKKLRPSLFSSRLMVNIFLQSTSVSPRIALISSNRSRNLLWSSSITTSELLMMASLTMGLPMMSCISCVTTPTEAQNLRAVLYMNLMYSAISGLAMAFHASSMTRTLRFFLIRIFCKNTSMIISVTRGNRRGSSFILSISKTMNVSSNNELSMFSFSVFS